MAWNREKTICISCADYENRFAAAFNANDLNATKVLLNDAVNCPWYSRGTAALNQRIKGNERCNQIDLALKESDRVKDLNRFRALVEQAKQANCSFYQNAFTYLQRWQQQAKPAPQQLVSEVEKQALTREIENVYATRWLKHWCENPKPWSGCGIVPKGAKDALLWKVVNSTNKKQLEAIRNRLRCYDPCIMGNLNDAQRYECTRRCDQQYPW